MNQDQAPTFPFGKHKGKAYSEIPAEALRYYLAWDGLRDNTRKVIEKELARRGDEPRSPAKAAAPTTDADPLPQRIRRVISELAGIAHELEHPKTADAAPAEEANGTMPF